MEIKQIFDRAYESGRNDFENTKRHEAIRMIDYLWIFTFEALKGTPMEDSVVAAIDTMGLGSFTEEKLNDGCTAVCTLLDCDVSFFRFVFVGQLFFERTPQNKGLHPRIGADSSYRDFKGAFCQPVVSNRCDEIISNLESLQHLMKEPIRTHVCTYGLITATEECLKQILKQVRETRTVHVGELKKIYGEWDIPWFEEEESHRPPRYVKVGDRRLSKDLERDLKALWHAEIRGVFGNANPVAKRYNSLQDMSIQRRRLIARLNAFNHEIGYPPIKWRKVPRGRPRKKKSK